jgi:hypothetical protein
MQDRGLRLQEEDVHLVLRAVEEKVQEDRRLRLQEEAVQRRLVVLRTVEEKVQEDRRLQVEERRVQDQGRRHRRPHRRRVQGQHEQELVQRGRARLQVEERQVQAEEVGTKVAR